MIPYARQLIDEADIRAVLDVLRSDWLTTGPKVEEFEAAVASFVEAAHGVAFSSGTAALHAAMAVLGVGPGDEVIVPAMTFAASANCVVFVGARPVFADVEADTLLLDVSDVERRITSRTKGIISVDYAGQPCDYERLRHIADRHGLFLVDDACHALGARYRGKAIGSLADMTVFSFHPVKHITTGEGGMVVTNSEDLASRLRRFRNHGISADFRARQAAGSWFYEMVDLGYNYRLTDIQCALGISQLRKLPRWLMRRREIAATYDEAFRTGPVRPLKVREDVQHAYHLYVVRLPEDADRAEFFRKMRERGVGVNVHYIPVHLHPFYRQQFGTRPGLCPVAESAYEQIVSLPMYAGLRSDEVSRVVEALREILM